MSSLLPGEGGVMSLRSLQLRPISTSHYYTSGDVTIQTGVAIAPGVLLQAEPNSQIVIQSGVCIGIGAILHACNGTIEIGAGASLGAEALLVGHVHIGGNACIGAATTIINSTVAPGSIIPPGSLIGDTSNREIPQDSGQAPQDAGAAVDPPPDSMPPAHPELPHPELQATDTVLYPEPAEPTPPVAPLTADMTSLATESAPSAMDTEINPNVNVYGRVFVNRMFVKMFPQHSQNQAPASDRPDVTNQDPWDD